MTEGFKPLEIEALHTVGGVHDGFRAIVGMGGTTGAMVSAHEGVHGDIFSLTTDGALLRSALVISSTSSDPLRRASFGQLAAKLLLHSRTAHEVFATYLGIKRAPSECEKPWLASMTKDYRAYFSMLDSILNPAFPSRVWQELIAWNAALVVFCSPLLHHVAASGLQDLLIGNHLYEASDERLRRVLEAIHDQSESLRSAMGRCLDLAWRRLALSPWDADSDDAWRLAARNGTRVQHEIAPDLQRWLAEQSGLDVLVDPERAEAERVFASEIAHYGINMLLNSEYGYVPGSEVTQESWTIADEQMNSRIQNPQPTEIGQCDPSTLEHEIVYLPRFSYVISLREDGWENGFDLLGWLDGPSPRVQPSVTHFAFPALAPFLSRYHDLEAAGQPCPSVISLVIPVESLEETHKWREFIGEHCASLLLSVKWYWLALLQASRCFSPMLVSPCSGLVCV
jgi:hypothetical protein